MDEVLVVAVVAVEDLDWRWKEEERTREEVTVQPNQHDHVASEFQRT